MAAMTLVRDVPSGWGVSVIASGIIGSLGLAAQQPVGIPCAYQAMP
jgi:hypothetical protein